MKPACPRLFEAEALRDGRLAGAELAGFERHLGVCPHCSREVEALQALGNALRAPALAPAEADELHVRRERTRLLAAFDAALVPPERARRSPGGRYGRTLTRKGKVSAARRPRSASIPPTRTVRSR
jgi:anti-sigma factor RsiW